MLMPKDPGMFSKNFTSLPALREKWGWFLGFGIFFVVLGLLAILSANAATLVSMIFLGSLLSAAGIVQLIYTPTVREWSGFFISLLSGILYGVVGFLMILHPTVSAVTLTLLLAAFYVVGGVFKIIASASMRFEHWGWALFSGLIKLALGMLIWLGWPDTGMWVLGLFIGIDLIFYGWFWILISLAAHSAKDKFSD